MVGGDDVALRFQPGLDLGAVGLGQLLDFSAELLQGLAGFLAEEMAARIHETHLHFSLLGLNGRGNTTSPLFSLNPKIVLYQLTASEPH
jgi:hypothetical protein